MTSIIRTGQLKSPSDATLPLGDQDAETQDFTLTGMGSEVPVGVLAVHPWTNNFTGTNSGAQMCVGFAAGSEQRHLAFGCTDGRNLTARRAARRAGDDSIMVSVNDSKSDPDVDGMEVRAAFDSFIAGGVRNNWITKHQSGIHTMQSLFAGSGTVCTVVDIDTTGVAQNAKIAVNTPCDMMFCIHTNADGDFDNSLETDFAYMGFGMALIRRSGVALQRGSSHYMAHSESVSTQMVSRIDTSDIASSIDTAGLGSQHRVTDWDPTSGFNIQKRRSQAGFKASYFLVKLSDDVDFELRDNASPTSDGSQTVSNFDLIGVPQWGISMQNYLGSSRNVQVSGVNDGNAAFAIGSFDKDGEEWSAGYHDEDQLPHTGGAPADNSETRSNDQFVTIHRSDSDGMVGERLEAAIETPLIYGKIELDWTETGASAHTHSFIVVTDEVNMAPSQGLRLGQTAPTVEVGISAPSGNVQLNQSAPSAEVSAVAPSSRARLQQSASEAAVVVDGPPQRATLSATTPEPTVSATATPQNVRLRKTAVGAVVVVSAPPQSMRLRQTAPTIEVSSGNIEIAAPSQLLSLGQSAPTVSIEHSPSAGNLRSAHSLHTPSVVAEVPSSLMSLAKTSPSLEVALSVLPGHLRLRMGAFAIDDGSSTVVCVPAQRIRLGQTAPTLHCTPTPPVVPSLRSELDDKMRARVAEIIRGGINKLIEFEIECSYDYRNDGPPSRAFATLQRLASPPVRHSLSFANGDHTTQGAGSILLPALDIDFEPHLGMLVRYDGREFVATAVNQIEAGETVAAYEITYEGNPSGQLVPSSRFSRLDRKMVAKALEAVNRFRRTVTFVRQVTAETVVAAVTPPEPYKDRYVDGDTIRESDVRVFVPPSNVPWTPSPGDTVALGGGVEARAVFVGDVYPGEQVALHEIQLRF